jgi:Phospholipid methyltransferase
LLFVGLLG